MKEREGTVMRRERGTGREGGGECRGGGGE